MNEVLLNFEEITIPFTHAHKSSPAFFDKIKKNIKNKVVIITDDKVKKLHVKKLLIDLNLNRNNSLVLSSPSGEQFKSIRTVHSYLDLISEWGIDRACLVICFGGGIPGNIGGLVAGLIYRGIRFIHIPTTLMAAFDSVISLKQAVNSNHTKNAFGIYYKPISIFSSTEFFSTLDFKQIRSGICETIKNVLAILPSQISVLSNQLKAGLNLKEEAIDLIKDLSIEAKQKVMLNDKYEKKEALVLEYGHTIGHAIELIDSKKCNNSILHGEAVGIGMLIEAEISHAMGYMPQKDLDTHYDLLLEIGIEPKLPSGINLEDVIKFVKNDNKQGYISTSDDEVGMILLKELGHVNNNEKLPITPVPIKTIKKVLKNFIY